MWTGPQKILSFRGAVSVWNCVFQVTVSRDEEHFMAENVNIPEGNSLISLSTELISHARLLC